MAGYTTRDMKSLISCLNPVDDFEFKLKKRIGVGTFGCVFLVEDSQGHLCAIKKLYLDPQHKHRELELLSQCDHPNILHYITHYQTTEGHGYRFLHLVTDYLHTDLKQFLEEIPFPPPTYLKLFGFQIFAGLCYLHVHGVCHRDIKLSNVLVDQETGRLELCDFGSAKILVTGEPNVSYIATRGYRAPELLLGCETYTTAVDIWAAGCVICEMLLCGTPLFDGRNSSEMMTSIMQRIGSPNRNDITFEHKKRVSFTGRRTGNLRNHLPKWIDNDLWDLISKILVYDPAKRLTAAQCMRHKYFQSLFDPNTVLPNGEKLPDYLRLMKTPEQMIQNFPKGPSRSH